MGKGRDKRKRAKEKKSVGGDGGAAVKESGASKTQRKTLQNAEKREQRKINKEDDIDAALAALELENQRHGAGGGSERLLEEMEGGPIPARSGFSICVADASAGPKQEHSFIVFGGERLERADNGASGSQNRDDNDDGKVRMFADLYSFDTKKRRWWRINVGDGKSASRPHPRSGHVSFFYRNCLYVLGGEYTSPNQNKFKHFKDCWRLNNFGDVDSRSSSSVYWEKLDFDGPSPSARSGHRVTRVGATSFAVFGGYFDDGEDVRYFNDLWILDMDAMKWRCVLPGASKVRNGVVDLGGDTSRLWPSPRSGFQFACNVRRGGAGTEAIARLFVHGGYVKEREEPSKKAKSSMKGRNDDNEGEEERGKCLSDTWLFDMSTLEWSRVKRQGFGPNARAGSSMAMCDTERAVSFGGVSDSEAKGGEVLVSEFYNELYSFNLDKMRWSPIAVGAARDTDAKKKAAASIPAAGNNGARQQPSALDRAATKIQAHFRGYQVRKAYRVYKLGGALSEMLYAPAQGVAPKKDGPKPLGRINAGLAVVAGNMYLYGGLIEMGDVEVCLDDCWALDLKKHQRWECINAPTISEEMLRKAGAVSDSDDDEDDDDDL